MLSCIYLKSQQFKHLEPGDNFSSAVLKHSVVQMLWPDGGVSPVGVTAHQSFQEVGLEVHDAG